MIRAVAGSVAFILLMFAGWGSWQFFRNVPHLILTMGLLALPLFFRGEEQSGIQPGRERGESAFEFYLIIVLSSVGIGFLIPYLFARHHGEFRVSDPVRYAGVALCLGGYALRLIAIRQLRRQFSYFVAIQQHHQLITTGIYSQIRHPIYLGAILLVIGMVLIFPTSYGFLFVLIYSMLLAHRMNQEEKLLYKYFGAVYQEYRSKSYRLIPHIY